METSFEIFLTQQLQILYGRLIELILKSEPFCLEFVNSLLLFNLSPLFLSSGSTTNISTYTASLFPSSIYIKSCCRQFNFFLVNTTLTTKTFSVFFCIIDSFNPSSYSMTVTSILVILIDSSLFPSPTKRQQRQKLISLFCANWCLILYIHIS